MDLPDVLKKVSKFKDDFEKLLEDMKIFHSHPVTF